MLGGSAIGFGSAACALILAAVASTAGAAGGVIEINQARALQGGVTATDAPGFPVTIDAPGSYILTSNLSVTAQDTSGIVASASNVHLDLRGFAVIGPGACSGSGAGLSCTPVGLGIGIAVARYAEVRSGSVRGFGDIGVAVTNDHALLSELNVEENGGHGIVLYRGSVTGSIVSRNGRSGIWIGNTGSVVERCAVAENRSSGIRGLAGSYVGNAVLSNGGAGIDVSDNAVIRNNVARGNADGIVVGAGCDVSDNSATQNASAGISALSTSSVQNNIATGNGYVGLYLYPERGGWPASYRGNVIADNLLGTVVSGIPLGENSCNGTTTCP